MEAFRQIRWLSRAVFAVALCCFTIPALAQFTSGVQGTITDPSGAVVADAAVSLTETSTNITYNATTNAAGVYRFVSLPPGNYVVTVKKPGFDEEKITTTLSTEETAGVNVTLRIAKAGQTVTVTGQFAGLNPDETRTELTLSASELELLPSQNHSTLNSLKLTPGVTGIIESSSDIPIGQNGPALSSNGMSPGSNLYTLDSVPLNSVLDSTIPGSDNRSGTLTFTPNLDSLTEIALQTTTFNEEYGTTTSMQVGMTTKAGANKFHGIADTTYEDKIMRAPAFEQSNKPAFHELFDSFALGGPIWKDHTFFFGSYEHVGSYGAATGTDTWWTPTFQSYIATADPNSVDVKSFMLANPATRLIPNGIGVVTAQTIFGSACGTPTAFNIPCSMNVTEQGVVAAPGIQTGRNWNIRLDQYFHGGKDRIFFFYFNNNQSSNAISDHPNWDAESPSNGGDYTANYTHTFSPNLLNSATFAYTHYNYGFVPASTGLDALLLPYDTLLLDSGSVSGSTFFVPSLNTESQYYGRDTVYWTHGRHSFEFGIESADNPETTNSPIYARPFFFYFDTSLDFLNDRLDEETIYSHYSGLTGQYSPTTSNGVTTRFGVYVQDSWKLTPRLMVDYGIRWDDLGNPSEYTGTVPWANAIFSDSNVSQIANNIVSKQVTSAFNSARDKNFMPRVGFAWTPLKNDPSTVLRGGVGLYQDAVNLANLAVDLTTNPPVGNLSLAGLLYPHTVLSYGTNPAVPPYGIQFPAVSVPTYRNDGSVLGAPTGITGVDPNLPISRTLLWNFAVEHELPGHAVFSVQYSGSHSYNLQYQADLNRPQGNYYCNTPGPSCTPTNHLLNTNWSTIDPFLAGLTSNYNALITQVRQTWRTLSWNASYTWSHALDMPNGWTQTISLPYDPQAEYASTSYDVTNRISAFYVCEIPVPSTTNGIVRSVVGGWNLSGTVVAESGQPFMPYYSNMDFAGEGLTADYSIPNYTGTQHKGWSKEQWKTGIFPRTLVNGINPLFPAPSCSCLGNSGRNQFRGPGYADWDQGIAKKITLPWFQDGKSALTLRGQAFNLLNRVNFTNLSNVTVNGGSFGEISGANQGRVIQMGARFEF